MDAFTSKRRKTYDGNPVFLPCTPAGVMELIKKVELTLQGKNVVVIGRSNIVGKPMAILYCLKMEQLQYVIQKL